MTITWDGDPQAQPIWWGTDEMMTLTPGEDALRRDMTTRMSAAISARDAAERANRTKSSAPSKPEKPEAKRGFPFHILVMGAVVLGFVSVAVFKGAL
jgi:outer membrane murein-binding lipoprotein Lpp